MSDRPDDMLSWLGSQILARKAAAEALPHGPWHIEGVYPQVISNAAAILIAETFVGPEVPPDIAQHIVAHDPQDTIARCETELAILDKHVPRDVDDYERGWSSECSACIDLVPCSTVRLVACAYRHRPGWLPEWAPEPA